jgi:hypothetical protein
MHVSRKPRQWRKNLSPLPRLSTLVSSTPYTPDAASSSASAAKTVSSVAVKLRCPNEADKTSSSGRMSAIATSRANRGGRSSFKDVRFMAGRILYLALRSFAGHHPAIGAAHAYRARSVHTFVFRRPPRSCVGSAIQQDTSVIYQAEARCGNRKSLVARMNSWVTDSCPY